MKNPLQYTWCVWYTHRNPHIKAASQNYEESMQLVSEFASVEQFWNVYQHLQRPSELPIVSDYMIFRKGIKPVWEDEFNENGGKWIVRLKKGVASRLWENLILALIGNEFENPNEMCGIVLSLRSHEDIISIWNHSAQPNVTQKIKEFMFKSLNLPAETNVEYKPHKDALKHLAMHTNNAQQQQQQNKDSTSNVVSPTSPPASASAPVST